MKKYFPHILAMLLLIMLVGIVAAPHMVHAAGDCPAGQVPFKEGCRPELPRDTEGFSFFKLLADGLLLPIGGVMAGIVMPLMSLLVYLSGMILNWSVEYSVVNMAEHVAKAGIDNIWTVIRDLANMGFIFVLLYTALQTMFGGKDYQKTIVKIVIAALLINFSLFFTKAIIDASNLVAMLFYNAITPNAANTTLGIASGFMDILGIQNLYNLANILDGTKLTIIGLGASVIYLIVSFTFLAVAAMFMIRFVVLLLVMILSPLMIIGDILPGVGDRAKEWWSTLSGQALFGPIYFMLTWITLKVAQGLFGGTMDINGALLGQQVAGTSMVQANPQAVQTFVSFGIIITLLVASLVAAKKAAGAAGGFAVKWAGGIAGGATFGVAGSIGRNTLGRTGAMIANNDKLKEAANSGSRTARLALYAGKKTSEKSFDARGAFGLGKTLGAGEVSKAAQGGYKKESEEAAKAAVSRTKSYLAAKPVVDADKKKREEERDRAKSVLDATVKDAEERAKAVNPDAADLVDQPTVEKARREFIERETKAARDAHTAAEIRARRTINDDRIDMAANRAQRGNMVTRLASTKIGPDIPHVTSFFDKAINLTNEAKAAAIRKDVKEKPKKDKLADLAAEVAKEEAEEKKKAEDAAGAPPSPTA